MLGYMEKEDRKMNNQLFILHQNAFTPSEIFFRKGIIPFIPFGLTWELFQDFRKMLTGR